MEGGCCGLLDDCVSEFAFIDWGKSREFRKTGFRNRDFQNTMHER